MAQWLTATFVALLISWFPTYQDPNSTASQTQINLQITTGTLELHTMSVLDSLPAVGYGFRSSREQCGEQSSIMWCAGYREYHEALSGEHIKSLDARARRNFTYLSDVRDSWRVHSHEVLNMEPWFGDCDDLATTTMDMLARQGQPMNHLWIVLVAAQASSRISGRIDHLIAIAQDDLGIFWVIGDTSKRTVELSEMRYRPIAFMSANDMEWHAAEPDNAFSTLFGVKPWVESWNLRNRQTTILPGTLGTLPNEIPVPVENR